MRDSLDRARARNAKHTTISHEIASAEIPVAPLFAGYPAIPVESVSRYVTYVWSHEVGIPDIFPLIPHLPALRGGRSLRGHYGQRVIATIA